MLLVVRQHYPLPLVELMVCDLLMCNICIFLIYELLYEFCVVESEMCQFVPQVSISVLYIDGGANYIASLYNSGVGALHFHLHIYIHLSCD